MDEWQPVENFRWVQRYYPEDDRKVNQRQQEWVQIVDGIPEKSEWRDMPGEIVEL